MTFPQKSAIATIIALVGVYGAYAATLWVNAFNQSLVAVAYKPSIVAATVILAVVVAVSHAVLAGLAPRDADAFDERDRQFARRAGSVGGYVLAVGVCGALLLALFEVDYFYIANGLLLAWVLAEIAGKSALLVYYGRAH